MERYNPMECTVKGKRKVSLCFN